jgi:hypothetical protein
MPRKYERHVAKSLGDLADQASWLRMSAPRFDFMRLWFPEGNIDTAFVSFDKGLQNNRALLGEALFHRLAQMSNDMRACFEADPEDDTGETARGKLLAREAEALLEARMRVLEAPPDK